MRMEMVYGICGICGITINNHNCRSEQIAFVDGSTNFKMCFIKFFGISCECVNSKKKARAIGKEKNNNNRIVYHAITPMKTMSNKNESTLIHKYDVRWGDTQTRIRIRAL